MESRARLEGEVGGRERRGEGEGEEVPFACYYHSMCRSVYNRLRAHLAGDRRTLQQRGETFGGKEEEACWTSDKSVFGFDQDLHTHTLSHTHRQKKQLPERFVTFFTRNKITNQERVSFFPAACFSPALD